jgi:DNA-binding transcriptional MerR regulator
MAEGNGIIDSEVAAMLLGISKNNLRQLVYRKLLTPVGRSSRRNMFKLQEVLEFQTRRSLGKTTE